MLLAQEYTPDLTKIKDKFVQTPLGLLFQGQGQEAINKLGADAQGRVQAMMNPESALQTGMDFMGGGLFGTFVGKGSKLWKQADYNKALKLEKEGATPEQIWQETGTAKFADGKWRQEISDKDAIVNEMNLKEGNLKYAINHPQLSQSYDDINNVNIALNDYKDSAFVPYDNKIKIGQYDTKILNDEMHNKKLAEVFKTDNKKLIDQAYESVTKDTRYIPNKSSLLHETQHKIQENENWARGGNPDTISLDFQNLANQKREEAQKLLDLDQAFGSLSKEQLGSKADEVYSAKDKALKLEEQAKVFDEKAKEAYLYNDKAFDLYKRMAGEAEARLTQTRMNLTDAERRANFPYSYGTNYGLDYPMEELFVRGILK